MTIRHTPRFLIPLFLTTLVAILVTLTNGIASAQDARGDDYGIWYVQGTAREPGGFLAPADTAIGYIDSCSQSPGQICEDRDGFLVYFGDSPDIAMDSSYTLSVWSEFPNPVITVSTFYDSLHIAEYAEFLDIDVREFARKVGLEPVCDALRPEFPVLVCDNVQTIPIGRIFAWNSNGGDELTFTPVPGDIGAYLVVIRADDIFATGLYVITLTRNA